MNYYLLFYQVVDDYVTRRAPYRDEHLRLVKEAYEGGELIMAGALANPVDQAILIFHAPDKTPVEKFIRDDPYVRHELIKQWEIRQWTVVIGNVQRGSL